MKPFIIACLVSSMAFAQSTKTTRDGVTTTVTDCDNLGPNVTTQFKITLPESLEGKDVKVQIYYTVHYKWYDRFLRGGDTGKWKFNETFEVSESETDVSHVGTIISMLDGRKDVEVLQAVIDSVIVFK